MRSTGNCSNVSLRSGCAAPTSAPGLGSPRPHPHQDWAAPRPHHPHRKLLPRVLKVRSRRMPPETRRVCMRARVRQCAPMHAGLCVRGCASACACVRVRVRACVCVGATIGRLGGWSDDAPLRSMRRRIWGRRSRRRCRRCPWPFIPHLFWDWPTQICVGTGPHLRRGLRVSHGDCCRNRSTSKSG